MVDSQPPVPPNAGAHIRAATEMAPNLPTRLPRKAWQYPVVTVYSPSRTRRAQISFSVLDFHEISFGRAEYSREWPQIYNISLKPAELGTNI